LINASDFRRESEGFSKIISSGIDLARGREVSYVWELCFPLVTMGTLELETEILWFLIPLKISDKVKATDSIYVLGWIRSQNQNNTIGKYQMPKPT
jgi:hypothetical protein